jgi:formamidopyrimidine-DNA glycosylase
MNPGGIEVFSSDLDAFARRSRQENRTLKRALTDPRIVSGIGNAYSDEILHAAQLSPITLTHNSLPKSGAPLHCNRADIHSGSTASMPKPKKLS